MIVCTGTPVRAERVASVSPGWTTAIAGFGFTAVGAPGKVSVWPMRITLGLRMPLADARACTVVPFRDAIDDKVSPRRTV